jgi:hypothetical protein
MQFVSSEGNAALLRDVKRQVILLSFMALQSSVKKTVICFLEVICMSWPCQDFLDVL